MNEKIEDVPAGFIAWKVGSSEAEPTIMVASLEPTYIC